MKLSVLRARWKARFFRRHRVRHRFGGHEFEICLADPLAQEWYDHDWDALPEIEILKRHNLKRGARVFNLGAHQCVVALMLAKEVGAEGSVIAVEANEHNAEIGRRNRRLNGVTQLNVLNVAVGEATGSLTFNTAFNGQVDDGFGRHGRRTVKAYTIDDLTQAYGFPDVVFVDIEGYECRVLSGAAQTLAHGPDWFIEMHVDQFTKFGGTLDSVLANFPERRFERYVRAEDGSKFVPFNRENILCSNRFFFLALGRKG